MTTPAADDMHSLKNYLRHGVYLTLYGCVKYAALPLSNYLRYAALRLFCPHLHSTQIGEGVTIWFPWKVSIGPRSSLNQGVIIDGFGGVSIGTGVRIAPYVCINTADHAFGDPDIFIMDQGFVTRPVVIEDDVWIGSGVHVNKGVTIGKGAVIGSGAVVTHDVPPYSVAAGVPCRVIKSRRGTS